MKTMMIQVETASSETFWMMKNLFVFIPENNGMLNIKKENMKCELQVLKFIFLTLNSCI